MTFGQTFNYVLPSSSDPEGLPYTTSLVSAPSYVTLLSNNSLNINPKNCSSDFGDQIVLIKIEDQEPKNFTYNITIKVPNTSPNFVSTLPQDQTVKLNSVLNYTLPSFSDPEGCPVILTLSPAGLSSFVSIATNIIKFAPIQYSLVGLTSISVILTDS
jgi:hypothetical protein